MIVDGISQEVTTTGIAESRGYKVKVGAKMFSLTMDKLYSNKLGSTVREVCSNAYDSHRSAGKADVPFNITLPTKDNEELTVEDFGTGLSNDRIFQLFGTLFESSKDQSNGDVGGFGLGSKSPFSIADTFTIESNWEGTKTHFLNYKDSFGCPNISITNTEPTEADNGIKIIIPLDYSERKKVDTEIRRQLYFFETKPTIDGRKMNDVWWTGGIEDLTTRKLSMKTTIYELPDHMFGATNLSHAVKIGPVLYPLDVTRLSVPIKNLMSWFKDFNPVKDIHKSYACSKVFVTDFPIGDLDISPSRESLSYIPDTLDKINGYFAEFFEQEETLLVEHVNKQQTTIERLMAFSDVISKQHVFESLKKLPIGAAAFGNEASDSMYDSLNTYLVPRKEMSRFRTSVSARRVVDKETGTPTFINKDDIGQKCEEKESYVVWPEASLTRLVFSSHTTNVVVSTLVARALPMFSIQHLSEFCKTRKHTLTKIHLDALHRIFCQVFEEPILKSSGGSLSPVFFFDDDPKKKKARIAKLIDEKDCFLQGNSYVIVPTDIGDEAKQYTTMESIIEYIAHYCDVDIELVRTKFHRISDLAEPAVVVATKRVVPKQPKLKKAPDELRGVYWDMLSVGTARVRRDISKENLLLSMQQFEYSSFLIVEVGPEEVFKDTYKRVNSCHQLSQTISLPIAYVSNSTSEDNRQWLKENGGTLPLEFVTPRLGMSRTTGVLDAMLKLTYEVMIKEQYEIYEILDIASTVISIDDRYPLPAFIECLVELRDQHRELIKKTTIKGKGSASMSTNNTEIFCRTFSIPYASNEINEYMFGYVPDKFRTPGMLRMSADTKAKLRYLIAMLRDNKSERNCIKQLVSKARVFIKNEEFNKPSFQLLTMLNLKAVKDVDALKTMLKCIR